MSKQHISFEFFPPKTDVGHEKLQTVWSELAKVDPSFFSVTYGAGGSTRDNTKNIVTAINQEGLAVAPHLSFGGDDANSVEELIQYYKSIGIKRIVALRGDLPSGIGDTRQLVYANELVEFIREKTGDHFHLEVAAYPEIHPEATSYATDVQFLKNKFSAGANSAITQYFFNTDAWFWFKDACDKACITQPIYPGIMPITNFTNLKRFSANCGAEIPRWLSKKVDSYGDDSESIKAYGIEVITKLCETLLEQGVPGLHFYTMNQVEPTLSILKNLNRA